MGKLGKISLSSQHNIRKRKRKKKDDILKKVENYFVQFVSPEGEKKGSLCKIQTDFDPEKLNELLNAFLPEEEQQPYYFYVNGVEIVKTLQDSLDAKIKKMKESKSLKEEGLQIVYFPQALFKVRPLTRCTSTLPGHSEAILNLSFSPNGKYLASGSGDATVRLWDLDTQSPKHTLKGHKNWVLCVAWSPDAKKIASGGRDSIIKVWDAESGKKMNKPLKGHKKWITSLSWEPFHLNTKCNRIVSASKDSTLKVWNVVLCTLEFTLSGHQKGVSQVKWNGDGKIYSCAQDCTVYIWSVEKKQAIKVLKGHGHWVNTMSLSTDYVLRRGAFDYTCEPINSDLKKAQAEALERYKKNSSLTPLRIVTGSDDYSLILWEPSTSKKPIARLTGHQGIVNQVKFSPDGRTIASASFDKTIRLWDAITGKFQAKLKGHVGAVYQLSWSGDSRLLISGSKDSTAKVWDVKKRKLLNDLPGHYDEVFSVDWSPDGQYAASGGKDRVLKFWRN